MPTIAIELNTKQFKILSNMSSVYGDDPTQIAKHLLIDCIATEENRNKERRKKKSSPIPSVGYTGRVRFC